MTGGDSVKIAKTVLLLRAAELRRDRLQREYQELRRGEPPDEVGAAGGAPASAERIAAAASRVRSAGAAVGGIRRGLRRTLDRVLAAGVDLPKLKPLWWEDVEGGPC